MDNLVATPRTTKTKSPQHYSPVGGRERWLQRAVQALVKEFEPFHGLDQSKTQVACSWPSTAALARTKRAIGECWYPQQSTDKLTTNLMVSPALEDPVKVMAVLMHEMVHAVCGPGCGHKTEFQKQAALVGLKAPWTATTATDALCERLNKVAAKLGRYPHHAIDRDSLARKKQGTRMLKVVCPDCGYTIRVTQKWIDEYPTLPVCPCPGATEMIEV